MSTPSTAAQRRIHILGIPNRPWLNLLRDFVPGTRPNLRRESRELESHSIYSRTIDPHPYPLNPFSRKGTFLAGLDPLRALRVLLFERRVDAVCCWYESGLFLIALLRPLFRFKPKLIMCDVSARGWKARDRVLDVVVPRVDGIMVLTAHQKAHTEAHYRLRRPAALVGFAIDDEFFAPEAGTDDGYVLSVGDDHGRDWDTLLKACSGLPHDVRLRTSAALPPLPGPNVRVLGRDSFTGLRTLYARARLVVLPLRPMSSPTGITALLEAMAMGKPVIVTDVGTSREVVTDGVDGITVPPGDPDALKAAIGRLMDDPGLRATLGRAARDTVERQFSLAVHFARQAAFIRSVVESAAVQAAQGPSGTAPK